MKRLIDTNIFVYAHNLDSPYRKVALGIVNGALNGEFEGCITPQNLLEFFSVITNPKRVENPLESGIAHTVVKTYWESRKIKKIFPSHKTFPRVLDLIAKNKISKAHIFDCFLVATMEENSINEIYTADYEHFKPFSFIKPINPLEPTGHYPLKR